MPKQIVPKSQITSDPAIALIKTFRVKNKRAGEFKLLQDNVNYQIVCEHLSALSRQASEEFGFAIWVNPNGKTGHNYPRDYKETPDEDNDYAEHLLRINQIEEARRTPEEDQDDEEGSDE